MKAVQPTLPRVEKATPSGSSRARVGAIAAPAGWQELAESAREPNPFFSPGIAAASILSLGDERERIASVDGGGKLLALAPVRPMRLGRIAPAIGVWTHPYAPLGTPLLDRDDPQTALLHLVGEMARGRGEREILLFPDIAVEGAVAGLIEGLARAGGRPLRRIGIHRRALLTAAPDAARLRDRLDRRRRKEFARQWRRLAEQGRLDYRRITETAELEGAALEFLDLEASGWKGRRHSALADHAGSRAFALAAIAGTPPGAVAIDRLSLDDRPIAMLIGFRAGDLAVSWKIAHDEAFARYSPGVQLMLEASDAWLADPMVARIDSLAAPDHPMIDGLWPERIAIGTLALGPVGGSALFDLGARLAEREYAARLWLRQRRHRKRPRRKEEAT